MESATSRTLRFDAPGLAPALAGQHIDVRLTAADGYTAQRSYSLSSAAAASPIEVTVDLMPDGEVSPYLVGELGVGDAVEVAGPIGRWFVWRPEQREPVQLIAGGSGIVPLMSMIRTRAAVGSGATFRLLASVRSPDREFYRDELDRLTDPTCTIDRLYTRAAPAGSSRGAGRIAVGDLVARTIPPTDGPTVYVCGPTGFVETVADLLIDLGHPAERVRTERFGPTG